MSDSKYRSEFRPKLTDLEKLLCLAISGRRDVWASCEVRRLMKAIGIEPCLAAARVHKIEALFVAGLIELLDADDIPFPCRMLIAANGKRVDRLLDSLAAVSKRLTALGVLHATIEAGGVLQASELPPCGYCSGDIDLLVAPDAMDHALAAFAEEGFVPASRGRIPGNRVEVCRGDDERREWLDVGAEPFDRFWVPLVAADRRNEWLKRARPSRKRPDISVLAVEDLLVQVAIHTSLHAFVRSPGLRLYVDVDRIVRDNRIDWSVFLEECRAVRLTTRVFVALAMASGLLETPIPEHVLRALAPSRVREMVLRALLCRAGLFSRGGAGLGALANLAIDALIDDRGILGWGSGILVPDESWIREHFDPLASGTPLWRLHLRRMTLRVKQHALAKRFAMMIRYGSLTDVV